MNSSENDDYWNKSELSKFNFEPEDNKSNDLFLIEDVINTSVKKSSQESSVHCSFGFNQNLQTESVTNYLSEKCINYVLDYEKEKSEITEFHNLPEDEVIRLLRRQIKERWSPPNIENTINRILLGQQYSFELYKSFKDKQNLLIYAVKSGDGDAVLAVVIYLAKTLKKSLVYQLLMDYPMAVSHYVHYLYIRRQISDLNDLLDALGKSKEAMMKQLTIASQNPQRLQQRLRLILKNYSLETADHQMVKNYVKLVEWQIAASKITNDQSIIGESAIYSLKYSNLQKLSIPVPNVDNETNYQSSNFVKCFGISDKQSLVVLLRVNAELKQWDVVEQLLIVKGWVGGKKLNTNLPVDKLLEELQKYGSPTTLIDNILMLVVDFENRVEIARKLGRHIVVIETLNKMKDKAALLQYMATLDSKSADYIYAESVLSSTGSRWKS